MLTSWGWPSSVHISTGTIVALKIIQLDTEDDITEVQREVALLSQFRAAESNNITAYYGCFLHKTELWIAMEFAGGGSIRTLVSACQHTCCSFETEAGGERAGL